MSRINAPDSRTNLPRADGDGDGDGERLRRWIQKAIIQCSDRGLFRSAKWLAEQLVAFSADQPIAPIHLSMLEQSLGSQPQLDLDSTHPCFSEYLLARTYFDLREFDRCSHVLQSCQGKAGGPEHPKMLFLRLYSQLLGGEKRKEEEGLAIAGPLESQQPNRELGSIYDELLPMYEADELDGFLLYLFGVVCSKQNAKDLARTALIRSVQRYPLNWSAWLELTSVVDSVSLLDELQTQLPSLNHFTTTAFLLNLSIELNLLDDKADERIGVLTKLFPESLPNQAAKAMLLYNSQDFERAEVAFEKLRKADPHSVEFMDTYSHVLFVMKKRAQLSYLAHNAVGIDKYKAETCCIIANYYSLRDEHERAVLYCKRALKLNRNYIQAFILMGHEMVELKLLQAAIEAYRRAIDINEREYRAWYGLGQAYEMLRMPSYAIYYYTKAVTIRPEDGRFWVALGKCYEESDRHDDAVRCYKRSLAGIDMDPGVLVRLAQYSLSAGDVAAAARYYKSAVENDKTKPEDLDEAEQFLSQHRQK
ncbi:putative cell division cycle protein 23 [Polychytrium aggregatum]|uniref:putative cell division cycle protein 23 n=1 Tax=Polychytrium aggregatum TaxID=110093 RepID=UPI0022FDC2CE|nr:putative cell division cycle protein 23 [Polychytrium aggregatum]KAI9202536.1 putative cell division cycle protein 23 [Polychytrium aggregatum]